VTHRAYEPLALSGAGEESEKAKGKRPAVEVEVMEDFEGTPKRLGETIPAFTPMASTSVNFATPHLQKQIASYAQYSPSPGHTYVAPETRTPAVVAPRKSGYVTTPLSDVYSGRIGIQKAIGLPTVQEAPEVVTTATVALVSPTPQKILGGRQLTGHFGPPVSHSAPITTPARPVAAGGGPRLSRLFQNTTTPAGSIPKPIPRVETLDSSPTTVPDETPSHRPRYHSAAVPTPHISHTEGPPRLSTSYRPSTLGFARGSAVPISNTPLPTRVAAGAGPPSDHGSSASSHHLKDLKALLDPLVKEIKLLNLTLSLG
jgi:hypothetical protein